MTRFLDLHGVEIEHGLGTRGAGYVQITTIHDARTRALGQLTPTQARQIADHLHESAARAEYEQDFHKAAVVALGREVADQLLLLVRNGETRRHTDTTGG